MGDENKKITQALKLAGNDREKAKKLASGELKDVRCVSGKFCVSQADIFSFFQLFFNIDDGRLMAVTLALFNDRSTYEKNNLPDSWKLFYTIIKQTREKQSSPDSADFTIHLVESVEGYQLFYDVQDNDSGRIGDTMREIVAKSFSFDADECQIELEDICSMELVDNKIPIDKLPKSGGSSSSQDEKPEIERLAAHTVEGALVISPVSGKYINDIVPGDMIKVMLVNTDEISMKIAAALNAISEDGEYLPIKGRVKEITSLGKDGYRVYCLIAKNILARIIEEENIKVELFVPEGAKGKKGGPANPLTKYLTYGVMVLVIVILLFVIFAVLL